MGGGLGGGSDTRSAAPRRIGAAAVSLAALCLWASSSQAGVNNSPAAAGLPTGLPLPIPTPTLPVTPPAPPLPSASPAVPPVPVPPAQVPGVPVVPGPDGPAGAPAGAPAPPNAPPAPPPAEPNGAVVPDSLLAHLVFADPFLNAQVGAILANPMAAQQPDLRHLSFVSTGSAAAAGPGRAGARADRGPGTAMGRMAGAALLGLALLAALVLVGLSPLARSRRWRAAPRLSERLDQLAGRPRLRWAVATALPAIAIGAGLVGVHQLQAPRTGSIALSGAPQRVNLQPGTVAALDVRSRTSPVAAAPAAEPTTGSAGAPSPRLRSDPLAVIPAPPAVLLELRGVEERISASHARLAAAESRVAQLAAAPLSTRNPAGQARSVRAAVAERNEALAVRDAALASEYSFYRSVAADTGRSSALVAAVQALGRQEVREGVVYNLQVVRTQLAEERALAALAAGSPETGAAVEGIPGGGATMLAPPFNGVLTQAFGPSSLGLEAPRVYQGVFYAHFHTGCDFAAPQDTPVAAGAPGVVVFAGQSLNGAGQLVGYGNYVVLAHPHGYQTLYGHLDRILVKPGQVVTSGQAVGLEGSTGWSTGPHTHLELRHLGEAVDPMPFLTGQPLS